MSNSAQDFAKLWSVKLERVKRVLRSLPRDVGNEALLFFNNLFKVEQEPNGKPWAPHKNNDGSPRASRRSLLVKTGRLRKSIRLVEVTRNKVTVGTNVEYAKYHHEGTKHMPRRRFLGKSTVLNRRLQRMIKARILWVLRK